MEDSLGRYKEYRYAQLSKQSLPEFGSWVLRGGVLHKVGDTFVISYDGYRIAEVSPKDECFLIVPKHGLSHGVVKRWSLLSRDVNFNYVTRRRATGITEYEVTAYKAEYKPQYKVVDYGKVVVTSRLRFNLDGTIDIADLAQKHVVKNNKKYNVFNKRLKDLRAVLYTQIKMQVHQFDTSDWDVRKKLREEVATQLHTHLKDSEIYKSANAYALVSKWMDTQDPQLAKSIAMLAFVACDSESRVVDERMLRQVANMLRRVQLYYLQEHCVTILEDIPGSANDQKSELQSPDGLRKVSVPGQAEVSGQDPGAAARTTRWKI